jgi:hypothetical protein
MITLFLLQENLFVGLSPRININLSPQTQTSREKRYDNLERKPNTLFGVDLSRRLFEKILK